MPLTKASDLIQDVPNIIEDDNLSIFNYAEYKTNYAKDIKIENIETIKNFIQNENINKTTKNENK